MFPLVGKEDTITNEIRDDTNFININKRIINNDAINNLKLIYMNPKKKKMISYTWPEFLEKNITPISYKNSEYNNNLYVEINNELYNALKNEAREQVKQIIEKNKELSKGGKARKTRSKKSRKIRVKKYRKSKQVRIKKFKKTNKNKKITKRFRKTNKSRKVRR